MKKRFLFVITFFLLIISCKKSSSDGSSTTNINLPNIVTTSTTNLTHNSVTVNSRVIDDGGAPVTDRGVCFSTSPNPTVANTKVVDGAGVGSFATNITGLAASTLYYIKGYATNSKGISYSSELTFTTSTAPPVITLPTVSIGTISGNTNTSQTVSGTVSSNGNGTLVGVWFIRECTHEVTGYKKDSVLKGTAVQNYSHTWTDCTPGLSYTYRISAKNSAGTSYSSTVSMATTGYHKGQDLGHGVVFAVNANANGYLECQKSDKVSLKWWPQGGPYTFQGATFDGLGNGDLNTNAIATHPQCQSTAAARVAYDCTDAGLTDWYLPNEAEFAEICANKTISGIGPLDGDPMFHGYWTSREDGVSVINARESNGDGITANSSKGGARNVRLIRKFNW